MDSQIKALGKRLKNEIRVYQRVIADQRTPRSARWLLGCAVAYAVSPIDLIPDFIPIVGHLDDILVLPLLVWLALRLVPDGLLAEARASVTAEQAGRGKGLPPGPHP